MKKIVLLALMAVCANGMFAQTEDGEANETANEIVNKPKAKFSEMSKEDMAKLWKAFQSYAMESQNDTTPDLSEVPVYGKTKFMRRNYISQRLEISIIGGTDNDLEDSDGLKSSYKTSDDVDDAKDGKSYFNYGLNIGYSVVIVPGKVNGDMLKLNRFGLGYSFGLVASFDRQEHYGTTCDVLAKIGAEAGNGHKLGIGVDFLVGGGKTAGEYEFDVEDDKGNVENEVLPYTSWCFKYGAQLWVRSKLLSVSLKDTDVRLFARYVYSVNPEDEDALAKSGIACNWMEESWSFGLTFCYTF